MAVILKYAERILIVLNADGSLKGASQYPLTRVLDDQGNPAMPDVQGGAEHVDPATLASILPAQAVLIAQAADLQTRLDAANQTTAAAQAAADKAATDHAAVQTQLAAVTAERDGLALLQAQLASKVRGFINAVQPSPAAE